MAALTFVSANREGAALVRTDRPGFALRSVLVRGANKLVEFLDPHLRSRSDPDKVTSNPHWHLRKILFFVIGVSLLLWAVAAAVVWAVLNL